MKKIKSKVLLGCLPLSFIPLVFILLLSLILGGSASFNVSSNAPAGVSNETLATAQAIVTRMKQEEPKATTNGLAAVLGCWQAESGLNPKRAEGDTLPYPVGAGKQPDSLTYDNASWLNLGGAAIYGANSRYASAIQERGLGLGQYTNGRNLALQAYAAKVGKPWYDLNTQLDYILNVDGDKDTLKEILTASGDVTSTTTSFLERYERGGSSGLALRIAYAQAWANWLNNPTSSGTSSVKGTIASLNSLVGQKVGSGQCYALSQWYVQTISHFRLDGMNAKDIGSDNQAAFQKAGWTVISNPQASDLKAGAIVCWGTGSASNSVYGHTGIINSANGSSFTTYEQNVNGNQTVQMYQRVWDSSLTFVIVPPQN